MTLHTGPISKSLRCPTTASGRCRTPAPESYPPPPEPSGPAEPSSTEPPGPTEPPPVPEPPRGGMRCGQVGTIDGTALSLPLEMLATSNPRAMAPTSDRTGPGAMAPSAVPPLEPFSWPRQAMAASPLLIGPVPCSSRYPTAGTNPWCRVPGYRQPPKVNY